MKPNLKLNWNNILEVGIGGLLPIAVIALAGYIYDLITLKPQLRTWLWLALGALVVVVVFAWLWKRVAAFLATIGRLMVLNWQLVVGLVLIVAVAYYSCVLTKTVLAVPLVVGQAVATVLLSRYAGRDSQMPFFLHWRGMGWSGKLWNIEQGRDTFNVDNYANGGWRLDNVAQPTGETRCKAVMETLDIRDGPIEFEVNSTKGLCELGVGSVKGDDANRFIKLELANTWYSIRMESRADKLAFLLNGKNAEVLSNGDAPDIFRPYIRVNKGDSVTVRNLKQDIRRRLRRTTNLVLPLATHRQAVANGIVLHYYDATERKSILSRLAPSDNLASEGKASASSYYDARVPQNIFRGVRDQDSWLLDNPSGFLEASWPKPVKGRFVLLLGRLSNPGSDKWQQATLSVNGKKIATLSEDFSGHGVLVIDIGRPVEIEHFRADIPGAEKPGLVGLEIFA